MIRVSIPFAVLLAGWLSMSSSVAEDLSPENLESLRSRLETMRENLESHVSTRNSSAGQRFAAAATDPKAAIKLYLECHKIVHYDREGRPDSDYRAWEDGQTNRLRSDAFVESLLLQLRYLALSCDAAEAEDVSTVFGDLLAFVDSLSRMEEMPSGDLTGSVANSIFAKAFYLEDLLGKNDQWESVPFHIGGIYDRTILPHLRIENPSALPTAWDKRIEQQSRIVAMIDDHKQAQLRGKNRDEERRVRNNQERQGGLFGSLDKEDYLRETLPRLKWGKMKDVFTYVSEVDAAQVMLPFVEERLTTPLGEEFYREFEELIEQAATGSHQLPSETGASN